MGRPEESAGPDGLNGPCGRKEEWGPGLDLRLGFWARGKSRPGWAASWVLGWVGVGFGLVWVSSHTPSILFLTQFKPKEFK